MHQTPIYRLPPYQINVIVQSLAEKVDWGLAAYGIPDAWKQTRGRGIRIAVLDTGIDDTHPDLEGVVIEGRDFTGASADYRDLVGHGTHVAGIVAARQNDRGVVGICPDLSEDGGGLLIGRVLGAEGAGLEAWVTAGIDWAVSQKADLISMSLGSPSPSAQMHAAIKRAVDRGVSVICAAGNSGGDNTVDYPGKYRESIAVAAVDRHGRVSSFSSRGPEVDIAAPGEDIFSTYPGGRYAKQSGTSMAAPFVTGVVALMLAKHKAHGGGTPVTSTTELREHLARTATDAGPKGHDPSYGFGLINPLSMLGAEPFTPPWLGLRWNVTIAGEEAAFVLVPRDAAVSLELPYTQTDESFEGGSERSQSHQRN